MLNVFIFYFQEEVFKMFKQVLRLVWCIWKTIFFLMLFAARNLRSKPTTEAIPEKSIADEPDSDRPSLLQLNDDCLLEICKHVPGHGLISLKQCSKRLRTVVDQYFTNLFATECIFIRKIPSIFLEKYGNQIQYVTIIFRSMLFRSLQT